MRKPPETDEVAGGFQRDAEKCRLQHTTPVTRFGLDRLWLCVCEQHDLSLFRAGCRVRGRESVADNQPLAAQRGESATGQRQSQGFCSFPQVVLSRQQILSYPMLLIIPQLSLLSPLLRMISFLPFFAGLPFRCPWINLPGTTTACLLGEQWEDCVLNGSRVGVRELDEIGSELRHGVQFTSRDIL